MSREQFRVTLWVLALLFAGLFALVVGPALIADPDPVAAFAAGFVNRFAAGFALDAILSWCVLAAWVLYERRAHAIRGGWIALALGVVPGVATGFAAYLLLRMRHREQNG
jgi:hypothetical protein